MDRIEGLSRHEWLLGALLRMPVDEIRVRMLTALHEQGFDDLLPAHLIVLRWPGPDGLRPVEIAGRYAAGQAMRATVGEVEQEFVKAHGKKQLATLLDLLGRLNAVLGTRPAG